MKDMNYYATMTTIYPNKHDYQTTYYYKAGVCVGNSNDKDIPSDYSVKETVTDEKSYREHLVQYNNEKAKLHNEFKLDLFEELGITDNPKREKLFEKAWENSRSAGLYAVLNEAEELVDLIN